MVGKHGSKKCINVFQLLITYLILTASSICISRGFLILWEHFDDYKTAMGKQPSQPGRPLARQADRQGQGELMEEEEGSSSWMAGHTLSHHRGEDVKGSATGL